MAELLASLNGIAKAQSEASSGSLVNTPVQLNTSVSDVEMSDQAIQQEEPPAPVFSIGAAPKKNMRTQRSRHAPQGPKTHFASNNHNNLPWSGFQNVTQATLSALPNAGFLASGSPNGPASDVSQLPTKRPCIGSTRRISPSKC